MERLIVVVTIIVIIVAYIRSEIRRKKRGIKTQEEIIWERSEAMELFAYNTKKAITTISAIIAKNTNNTEDILDCARCVEEFYEESKKLDDVNNYYYLYRLAALEGEEYGYERIMKSPKMKERYLRGLSRASEPEVELSKLYLKSKYSKD